MYNMPGLPGEPSIEDVGMQTRGRIRFARIRHRWPMAGYNRRDRHLGKGTTRIAEVIWVIADRTVAEGKKAN
jgi:hypothetical protein